MTENEIVKYRMESKGYSSIMRGIPVSEENLDSARSHLVKVYEIPRSKTYVMYRGPRTGYGNCTLKKMPCGLTFTQEIIKIIAELS